MGKIPKTVVESTFFCPSGKLYFGNLIKEIARIECFDLDTLDGQENTIKAYENLNILAKTMPAEYTASHDASIRISQESTVLIADANLLMAFGCKFNRELFVITDKNIKFTQAVGSTIFSGLNFFMDYDLFIQALGQYNCYYAKKLQNPEFIAELAKKTLDCKPGKYRVSHTIYEKAGDRLTTAADAVDYDHILLPYEEDDICPGPFFRPSNFVEMQWQSSCTTEEYTRKTESIEGPKTRIKVPSGKLILMKPQQWLNSWPENSPYVNIPGDGASFYAKWSSESEKLGFMTCRVETGAYYIVPHKGNVSGFLATTLKENSISRLPHDSHFMMMDFAEFCKGIGQEVEVGYYDQSNGYVVISVEPGEYEIIQNGCIPEHLWTKKGVIIEFNKVS